MRILAIALLSTCLTGTAFAAEPAKPLVTATGKVQIGYEGRGDYLKNDKRPDKDKAAPPVAAASNEPISLDALMKGKKVNLPTGLPTTATPATAPAAAATQSMRSDSSLRSDSTKAKTTTATPPTTTTASASGSAASANSASNNNSKQNAVYSPPVYVNGQLQKTN